MAALADFFPVRTAWHGPGDIGPPTHAANVHVDISIPNFGIQEMVFFPDQVREVITGRPIQGRLHHRVRAAGPGLRRERRGGEKIPLPPASLPAADERTGACRIGELSRLFSLTFPETSTSCGYVLIFHQRMGCWGVASEYTVFSITFPL